MEERAEPANLKNPAESTEGSAQVFISYASQDKDVADAVCQALERAGVTCWIAPRDVVPGESYASAIVHAIDATRLMVLVLSENATTSPHVLREVERAASKLHAVVAFRIDLAPMSAELEYFLNSCHWLDTSASGVPGAMPHLVDAVQRVVVPSTHPLPHPVALPTANLVSGSGKRVRAAPPARATRRGSDRKRLGVVTLVGCGLLIVVGYRFHWRLPGAETA